MEIPVLCVHKRQADRVAVLNTSKGESAWTPGVVFDVIQALEESTLGECGLCPRGLQEQVRYAPGWSDHGGAATASEQGNN